MEGQPYTVATSHQLYSKGIATNQNILATTPNNTFAPRTSISSDPTSNYLPFFKQDFKLALKQASINFIFQTFQFS